MTNGSRFAATFVLCGLLCCQMNAAEDDAPGNSVTTIVYQVADILQAGSPDANSPLPLGELVQLIQENVAPDSWNPDKIGPYMKPFAATQSLIIGQTKENHQAIADLLQSLRHLCDVKVSMELRFVQMPEAFTAQWTEPRVLSSDEWQKVFDTIQTEPQATLQYAPKITLSKGQCGTVSLPNSSKTISILLTGVPSPDRRVVSTKVHFDYSAQPSANTLAEYSIPDTQTAFVGILEDRPGLLFDRAHLSENGINIAQKPAAKTVVFLTTRLIVREEEEETLSSKSSRSQSLDAFVESLNYCATSAIPRDGLESYPDNWEDLKKARPKRSPQKPTEQPSAN